MNPFAPALVGIYVFLFGNFGKTEAKILGTTLTICYFSTTSLACSAAFEKQRHPALSLPGLALGVLGLVFFIPSIWAEWFDTEAVGKAFVTAASALRMTAWIVGLLGWLSGGIVSFASGAALLMVARTLRRIACTSAGIRCHQELVELHLGEVGGSQHHVGMLDNKLPVEPTTHDAILVRAVILKIQRVEFEVRFHAVPSVILEEYFLTVVELPVVCSRP